MPVVIKHKLNAYIGRNNFPAMDINKAKRYKSVSAAKAAIVKLGYKNSEIVKIVEVEK